MKKQITKRICRRKWLLLLAGVAMLTCNPIRGPYVPVINICYAAEKEPEENWKSQEEFLLHKTNEERKRFGLTELVEDKILSKAAMIRAREQQKEFSHTRPDGTPFYTVFSQLGIGGTRRGENLARGMLGIHDRVFSAWMSSEGHRANVLDTRFTRIGIAYAEINGIGYWCQLFAN